MKVLSSFPQICHVNLDKGFEPCIFLRAKRENDGFCCETFARLCSAYFGRIDSRPKRNEFSLNGFQRSRVKPDRCLFKNSHLAVLRVTPGNSRKKNACKDAQIGGLVPSVLHIV